MGIGRERKDKHDTENHLNEEGLKKLDDKFNVISCVDVSSISSEVQVRISFDGEGNSSNIDVYGD